MMPSGVKAGTALCGASCGVCSPPHLQPWASGSRRTPAPALRALRALDRRASTSHITAPTEALPPSERKSAAGPGLLRTREASVPVEFFQDCRVGVFEQPLLGERRGVTGVHEDPVVTLTAVHATAADRVVQGLVLGNREAISRAALGTRPTAAAVPAMRPRVTRAGRPATPAAPRFPAPPAPARPRPGPARARMRAEVTRHFRPAPYASRAPAKCHWFS